MKRNLLLILCGLFLSGFFGPSDPKGQFDKAMEYYSDGKTDKYEKWLIKAKEQNYAPAFFQHYLSQTGQEPRLTEGSPNTEFITKCWSRKLDKEEIEAFNFILWEYEYTEKLNLSNNTPGFAFCKGINNLKQAVNLQFQPAIAEVPRVERAIKKNTLKRIQQRQQDLKDAAEYKAQREKEREEANRKAEEEAIPDGAKLDSNQLRGWECKDSYYRNIDSSGCIKVPSNGKKMGKSNFKCISNFRKLNNQCVSKLQTQKQNSNNSNKSNNDPTLSEMIEACKYIGSQITKLGFGFSNSNIGKPFSMGGIACGKHYERFISIKSVEPPRVYISEPGDFFGIGGTCVDFKTLKYWEVEEGKDCR